MRRYVVTTPYELRLLIQKNNWLSFSTDEQFRKLEIMNEGAANIEEIALVIWFGSNNSDSFKVIKDKLYNARNNHLISVCSGGK